MKLPISSWLLQRGKFTCSNTRLSHRETLETLETLEDVDRVTTRLQFRAKNKETHIHVLMGSHCASFFNSPHAAQDPPHTSSPTPPLPPPTNLLPPHLPAAHHSQQHLSLVQPCQVQAQARLPPTPPTENFFPPPAAGTPHSHNPPLQHL